MDTCNLTVRSDVLRLYASAGVTSNVIVGINALRMNSKIIVQESARIGQNTIGMDFTRLSCPPERQRDRTLRATRSFAGAQEDKLSIADILWPILLELLNE